MTIEKLLEKLPPETNCVLTPKKGCDVLTITFPQKGCDVLTITFPQKGKKGAWQTGIGFEIWLAFCTCVNNNRKAKEREARRAKQ